MKLKPEIKAEWVSELRSGNYVQGNGYLREEVFGVTKFCCLGVLCNIHAKHHPEFAATQTKPKYYDGKSVIPSVNVLLWAGFPGNVCLDPLWHKNDGVGTWQHSFAEIADYIEENY